jgi:hypothetical protein
MTNVSTLAQNVTETAPWWGTPLIAGIFLVLGGLATKVFDLWAQHRNRRDRWLDDLRQFAVHFLAAMNEHTEVALRVRRGEQIDLNVSLKEMARSLADVVLVANDALADRARHLKNMTIAYGVVLEEHGANTAEARQAFHVAYDEFIEETRKALGIKVQTKTIQRA